MFYLRWIFLFSLFVFSGFSLATGDSKVLEYSDQERPDSSKVLENSDLEVEKVPSFLNSQHDILESSNPYPGVVKLILEDQSKAGTGFFIKPDILTTARHVAIGGPLYFRDPLTGDEVFTEVLGFDDKYDLALLKAVNYESEDFYSVGSLENEAMNDHLMTVKAAFLSKYDSYEVEKRDTVTMVGFPHGSFHVMNGIITKGRGSFTYAGVAARRDNGFYGMSGGPVFSEDRELFGVISVQREHGSVRSYGIYEIGFIPIGHLRNLIRRVENGEVLSPAQHREIIQTIFRITKHKKFFHSRISDY